MKWFSDLTASKALMLGGALCMVATCVEGCFNTEAAGISFASGVVLLFAAGIAGGWHEGS